MIDRRGFLIGSGQLALAAALSGSSIGAATAAPPAESDPSYLPAAELLKRFRSGELSPVDVLEAQIKRIEGLNAEVNCITYKHYDEARTAAQESAQRYKAGNPRALEGITVAVKDEYDVKGWITTMGSLRLENAAPARGDGAVIDMLRKAGAVLHIQTTVPEFYVWMTTASRLWGVTRNPWNLAYSPGGSSGGSGSALAAGFTTLALGSDMGGSIRLPSSLCGLYGYKPPFGRVPTSEIPYETDGPMARTFDDLNLFIQVISGPHPLVHSSLRPKLDYPNTYGPVDGWKIAYDPMKGISSLDPPVAEAMEKAIGVLKGVGVRVETIDLGFAAADLNVYMPGLFSTSMGSMLTEAAKDMDKLAPYTRQVIEKMTVNSGPDAANATDMLLADYHTRVQEKVFGQGFNALIAPVMATALVPAEHGLKPETDAVLIDGQPVTGLGFAATWPWNLLGRYPVVAAPAEIGPGNMPIGFQIIGNTFDDLTAFQLASAYASAAPPLFSGEAFPDFRDDPV